MQVRLEVGETSSERKVTCLKVAQEDSSRAGIIPQGPSAVPVHWVSSSPCNLWLLLEI